MSKEVFRRVNQAGQEVARQYGQNLVSTRVPADDQAVDLKLEALELVSQADLIVADLTGEDRHVLFYVGYALSGGAPLLLFCRPGHFNPMPAGIEVLTYEPSRLSESVRSRLVSLWSGISNEPENANLLAKTGGQTSMTGSRGSVFISYSHADDPRWLRRIQVHLKPLARDGRLDLWDDTQIRAGNRWRDEIKEALARAHVAVLLISADFYASDFIDKNELPPLLEAARNERGLAILGIHINYSQFEDDHLLSEYQTVNSPSRPLEDLKSRGEEEKVFRDLARRIKELLPSRRP